MYTFKSRVRYSEIDADGRLGILGMMNYLQDGSTFHSEDAGVGVDYFQKNHKAWMLSSWRIRIEELPKLGETILVGTWPTAFKGLHGFRDFVIQNKAGMPLVTAHSVWFLYDTQRHLPLRVSQADQEPYGEPEPPLDMGEDPGKIRLPEAMEEGEPVWILRHHLDTNCHVNNAWYVEMARDALPERIKIREIRADYKKAALLEDIVTPRIGRGPAGEWIVALEGRNGEICAAICLTDQRDDSRKDTGEQKKKEGEST